MVEKTACYTRVSTSSQSTAIQVDALSKWAMSESVTPVWYEDTFTGNTMDRPGWRNLWAEVESDNIAVIVVWKLDRLGRTCRGLVKLLDELRIRGVRLISLTESIDIATPGGRLMANVLASVSQFEQEVRHERQAAGIAKAKATGKKWGGSKPGTLKAQPGKVAELRALGITNREIARTLNISTRTVMRYINHIRDEGGHVAPSPNPRPPQFQTQTAITLSDTGG